MIQFLKATKEALLDFLCQMILDLRQLRHWWRTRNDIPDETEDIWK